jgi:hypothetical protein
VRILILTTFAWAIVTSRYQAAKDVSGSQYTLIDILERMEILFQRVEAYTEIAPTKEMTNIIMKIMVEALTILGIATKEIKQGRASELSMYKYTLPLIELSAEKFAKRLLGRLDIEDALKRLDMLTNEEARMATALVLKATCNLDDRVRGVSDRVAAVDYRVAAVDDRVAAVDEKVTSIDERMKLVDTEAAKVDGV